MSVYIFKFEIYTVLHYKPLKIYTLGQGLRPISNLHWYKFSQVVIYK